MRKIVDSGDGEKGGREAERPRGKLWEEEGEPAELWRNSLHGPPWCCCPAVFTASSYCLSLYSVCAIQNDDGEGEINSDN